MPLWRQMYLGASSELELRVTAPYNSQPVGKCFICRLPDEILLQILDNATIPDMPDTSKDQPRGNASAVEEFMFHSVPRSYTGESNTLTDLGNTAQYGSEDLENDESQYEEEDSAKEVTQEALPATTVPLHGKASNISLRLVCKRWQRVYDEIFFRDILIGTFDGSGGPDAGRRIRSFLTVLENRPLLQTYPRSFYIDLDKIGEIACRNAVRIVSLCKNVKSLSIHTELKTLSSSTSTWPLLEATKNLKLERLHITWPSLHLLQNLLDISSIRDISFDRFGPGIQKTDPFASWVEDDEIVHGQHSLYKPAPLMQSEVEELFPKSKDYSWGATSLRLSDPCCDPVVTEHIVRMPARLQILSLTELDTCIVSEKYTLAAVQAIIEIQRNTLQTITLSRIPNENKTMPDFTVFPALKSLTMSAYDIMQIEKPSVALQKLSGTPLRKLCLDITPEDEQEPFTIEQQTEWASWLTEFASEKQSKYPDSELEEVFILFEWTIKPWWLEPADGRPWPWEYLERAKTAVAKYGLAIGYEEPHLSKEIWDTLASRDVDQDAAEHSDSSVESCFERIYPEESKVLMGWLYGRPGEASSATGERRMTNDGDEIDGDEIDGEEMSDDA